MRVYLDLDGVLVDFVRSVYTRLFGMSRERADEAYEETTDWHAMPRVLGITDAELWDAVDGAGEGFWLNLPMLPWAAGLLNMFPDAVVLTAPTPHPSSAAGKHRWCQLHSRKCVITTEKHLLANSKALLIDDNEENIRRFVNAGGQGLLWPAPWNRSQYAIIQEALSCLKR